MTAWLTLAVQVTIASAIGVALVAACRWLRRVSPLCGGLVAAGLLVRAAMMLILFWTSFLNLPIVREVNGGDGFWNLFVDARLYYRLAYSAAHDGFAVLPMGGPSLTFVKILALWMRAVGSSPMSGAYLNLVLYVLLSATIVAAFRPGGRRSTDLPCAIVVAALAFSPVLVIHSTQPLKDATFVFLIGITCVAAFEFLPLFTLGRSAARRTGTGVLAVAALLAALYLIAGIRSYFAVIVWSALALVLFAYAWRQGRARWMSYVTACVLLLAAAWGIYVAGAGPYYVNPYAPVIDAAVVAAAPVMPAISVRKAKRGAAGSMVRDLDQYRAGFVLSGGGTSIGARMPGEDSGPNSVTRKGSGARRGALAERAAAAGVGLGLIFVPVSALRALSIVNFSGGRGLLAITDLDTLFMDAMIVAALVLLARRRSALGDQVPYLSFAVVLVAATALLMAYIVTNFGALFRLRLMVAVPIWMLPLALSSRVVRQSEPGRGGLPDDADVRTAERTRASFGYEWTHFHDWRESSSTFHDYFETADLAALRGCRVLDAGCGMGRHARQMAAHARHVVAVDFSRAIERAAVNTRGVGRVDCVQADLLRLPFRDGTFDYVYSLGVLHHLGNTEAAVRALVAQLKPGGRLRVYLYWKRHGGAGAVLRLVSAARMVTTRLPFWLLRWLCWMLSVGLWSCVVLPYRALAWAGVRGMTRWPLFVYAKYPFRVLYNDQFDRFSAPLEKRYDPEDVSALLGSAGLRDVRVDACFGWVAEGVKPVEHD